MSIAAMMRNRGLKLSVVFVIFGFFQCSKSSLLRGYDRNHDSKKDFEVFRDGSEIYNRAALFDISRHKRLGQRAAQENRFTSQSKKKSKSKKSLQIPKKSKESKSKRSKSSSIESISPSPTPIISLPCGMTPEEREIKIGMIADSVSNIMDLVSSTPQSRALEWIINMDEQKLCPTEDNVDRIAQRYIASVIYYSTGGDEWGICSASYEGNISSVCPSEGQRWLSSQSECNWFRNGCNEKNSIKRIDLSNNLFNLKGTIPLEVFYLPELEELNLDGPSKLSGPIPDTIGIAKKLKNFDIDAALLDGNIPESLYNVVSLESLDINQNKITGILSSKISQLKNLKYLSIGENSFDPHKLSAQIGDNLVELESLIYNRASVFGTIPSSFKNLTNMVGLDLSGNALNGSINSLLTLKYLKALIINDNMFSGYLSSEIGLLSDLQELRLENNSFTGNLPTSLGSLKQLKSLGLANNQFIGPLPPNLGNLTKLEEITLNGNKFTGPIPSEICSLRLKGKLTKLIGDCGNCEDKDTSKNCCSECLP